MAAPYSVLDTLGLRVKGFDGCKVFIMNTKVSYFIDEYCILNSESCEIIVKEPGFCKELQCLYHANSSVSPSELNNEAYETSFQTTFDRSSGGHSGYGDMEIKCCSKTSLGGSVAPSQCVDSNSNLDSESSGDKMIDKESEKVCWIFLTLHLAVVVEQNMMWEVIIWFVDTVTVSHLTKCVKKSKVWAMSA